MKIKINLNDALAALEIATVVISQIQESGIEEVEVTPEKARALRISDDVLERWKALGDTKEGQ